MGFLRRQDSLAEANTSRGRNEGGSGSLKKNKQTEIWNELLFEMNSHCLDAQEQEANRKGQVCFPF